MFLETVQGIEHSAYGLPIQRRIPEAVERFYRERATCYECGQRIHYPRVTVASRGIHIFHESCAQRHDSKARRESVATTPKIIGHLYGAALTFNRQGDRGGWGVVNRDGTPEHEAFEATAFDESIAAGGQILCLRHDRTKSLTGSFSRLLNDGGQLRFRFSLQHGALERSVLQRIQAGAIKGCSIAFLPGERRYRDRILVHSRARLLEISLCDGSRPQWHSTWVRAEAA